MDAVDSWQVYDNAHIGGPRLVASATHPGPPAIMNEAAWQNLKGRRP
jgi:hypothetical protein